MSESPALCARVVEIYLRQPGAGRAALLGFLHTSADARDIKVRLCTRRSGAIALLMEAMDESLGDAEPDSRG